MSRVTHLVQWIPLLYMAFFIIYWARIYSNEMIEFDEYVLDLQVNYAADAAVEELLLTGHTEQDYNNSDFIVVEPELAVIEFTSILAEDFDLIATDFTRQQIQEQYIKTLLICTWDGVYAYWYQPTNETNEHAFVGTPKIPYFYTDDNGKQYCLNLGLEKAYCDAIEDGNYKLKQYETMENPIPKDIQLTAINNQVANILNYTLIQSYSGNNRTAYEIPALASDVNGAQPVDQITVLGVVEGQATVGTSPITAECIGGAQITKADPVIGVTVRYKNSGLKAKVYAYQSYWKEHNGGALLDESNIEGFIGNNGQVVDTITEANIEFFDTPFDAALDGYYDLYTTLFDHE